MTVVDTTASGIEAAPCTSCLGYRFGNTTITVSQSGSTITAKSFSGGADVSALPETTASRFAKAVNDAYHALGL